MSTTSATPATMAAWTVQELQDGDDEAVSCEPSLLPAGFDTTDLLEWKKCRAKTTVIQQRAALGLIEARIEACASNCWDELTKEAVASWWNDHCSMDIVRWSMALHGLPWSTAISKAQLVEVLMKYQAPPLPFEQISAFEHAWMQLSEEQQVAVSRMPPPVHHIPSSITEAVAPLDADASPASSSEPLGSVLQAIDMKEILAGMHAGIAALVDFAKTSKPSCSSTDTSADPASTENDVESGEDKLLKKASAAITADTYFNISSLHEGNLELLRYRFATGAKPRASSLAHGISIISSEFREKDFSKIIDWNFFQSGFLTWVRLMAGIPAKCSQIADRIEWFQKLLKISNVQDHTKAMYARKFTRKYAGKEDWKLLFDNDCALFHELSVANTGPKNSLKRKADSTSKPAVAPKKPKKHCFSRSDPRVGNCSHANCRFSHRCAMCGKDHAADLCST